MSKKVKLKQKYPVGYDPNMTQEERLEFLRKLLPPPIQKKIEIVDGKPVLLVKQYGDD